MQTANSAFAQSHTPVNCPLGAVLIKVGKSHFAIVDPEDLPWLSKFTWKFDREGYAKRVVKKDGKETQFLMHRIINQTPAGLFTDHINGDKLDNRRSNLRNASAAQNSQNAKIPFTNKSGFKGVSWKKKKFRAQIKAFGKCYWLGYFKTPEQASLAYQSASLRLHGDFARK